MTTARLSRSGRRVGASLAAVAALAILHFGSTGGLPALADDLCQYPALQAELARDEARTAELDDRIAVSTARTEFRDALYTELVAGRVSIRAAATEYRAVVGTDEAFDHLLTIITVGSDDTERMANYLLTSLVNGRTVPATTRDRLAAEFHAAFGHEPSFAAPLAVVATAPR